MTYSKYIIVEVSGFEVPIVFSPLLTHREMAGILKVVAAGFCKLHPEVKKGFGQVWECWGESESLGIKSREWDCAVIQDCFCS